MTKSYSLDLRNDGNKLGGLLDCASNADMLFSEQINDGSNQGVKVFAQPHAPLQVPIILKSSQHNCTEPMQHVIPLGHCP